MIFLLGSHARAIYYLSEIVPLRALSRRVAGIEPFSSLFDRFLRRKE